MTAVSGPEAPSRSKPSVSPVSLVDVLAAEDARRFLDGNMAVATRVFVA
jgi:hypothetical protein